MSPETFRHQTLWSIVLAGGDGRRMRPFIERWLGSPLPKQYCLFADGRSLFQRTLDRADRLTAPDRKVIVIGRTHEEPVRQQMDGRAGRLVVQPANRETAPGVFLPLTYLRACQPAATVVIHPSDHFVSPEGRFLDVLRHAALVTELLPDRLLLVAAEPDGPDTGYGWLHPGRPFGRYGGHRVWGVSGFEEKPDEARARACWDAGAWWNTMVVVAKAQTLWDLGWRCLPETMRRFERLLAAIGTEDESAVLESIYREMPAANFSVDVLQRVAHRLAAVELTGVTWSDWGTPDRLVRSLRRLGIRTPFHAEQGQAARSPATEAQVRCAR